MKKNLIGIDIGGTTVKIALLTWEGAFIENWEIPTNTADKGVNILPEIAASIFEKIAALDLTIATFHAAGVGVPGPVQINVGYLPIAVNLGGFGDININDTLGSLLGIPVITDNDANVAAVGEMWLGSGEGATDMVFVTLGTGVGGGIITDGHIVSGFSGAGGEIGHMPFIPVGDAHHYACNCGASGCLETVCSATGIVRVAKQYLAESPELESSLVNTEVTSKAVFDAAIAGDKLALKVVDTFAKTLTQALHIISVTTNPEVYVIGGGVSKAGDFLLEQIGNHFGENIFQNAIKNVEIKLAMLGNEAGVIGAARHARGIAVYEK